MSTLNGGPGNIVTNGLVLYLEAANYQSYVSGSTTWRDLSSSNLSGSLINGPTYNSGNAGSIVFDGVDDYVRISGREDLDFPNANFTAACWFKSTQSKTYVGLLGKIEFGIGTAGWTLEFSDAKVTCWTNSFLVQSPLTYNDGNWHYGVMTMGTPNTGQINVYVDGYVVQTSSMPSYTFDPTNLDLWIGGWTNGTSYLFNGSIANTHIYNRILTASEVLQNYNATKGRFGL